MERFTDLFLILAPTALWIRGECTAPAVWVLVLSIGLVGVRAIERNAAKQRRA